MPDQVHETCEPIRPQDIPDDIVAAAQDFDLANRRSSSWQRASDAQVRRLLAGALTEVCERIAQAVVVELAEEGPDDMLLVTREGERAAALIRSWPEDLDG